MLLQWAKPGYVPRSFSVSSGASPKPALWKRENRIAIADQTAKGQVSTEELAEGLFLIQSQMAFPKDTSFRETYPERNVFQLAFCLEGACQWNYGDGGQYRLTPAQCSLQYGRLLQCESHYQGGQPYRTVSLVLERDRFAPLAESLESARLLRRDEGITTQIFPTTPALRLVLQQILDCPADRLLRRVYLEGKALELFSLFWDETAGQKSSGLDLSREDCRLLVQAREFIDRRFLHPLTISQIAGACYLSETKLKQGFKACFGCTVYEYIVEKRMEMAFRLLKTGDYRVKDVAWMVGYSNASHFIDAFKKRYGLTPGEVCGVG